MPTRKGIPGMKARGIALNGDIMAAAYDYLRSTPPFNRWGLPPSKDVGFRVTRSHREAGVCEVLDSGKIRVGMSSVLHGHSASILVTMGHEMIHVRQFLRNDPATHGKAFQKMAEQVCEKHGFDLLGF